MIQVVLALFGVIHLVRNKQKMLHEQLCNVVLGNEVRCSAF